jgi:hypothetical protein
MLLQEKNEQEVEYEEKLRQVCTASMWSAASMRMMVAGQVSVLHAGKCAMVVASTALLVGTEVHYVLVFCRRSCGTPRSCQHWMLSTRAR